MARKEGKMVREGKVIYCVGWERVSRGSYKYIQLFM